MTLRYDVVVPTVGRPALETLLAALAEQGEPLPERVLVVDDRPADERSPLSLGPAAARLRDRLELVRADGGGPAAARNVGWRRATAPWVAFLDDDVVPRPDWSRRLALDLEDLSAEVVASQGRVRVPLPRDRRPTDRERCVAGLADADWATADIAYRRRTLAALGGFDERFPRAYREDADLGLRALAAGGRIVSGRRSVVHPVGPAGPLVSVRLQAGNADDVLMRALHGRDWRRRAGAPAGRRRRHLTTVAAAALAATGALAGRRRLAGAAALGWALGTAELAWARIAPGPRDAGELATMLATSVLIPPAAAFHSAAGVARLPLLLRDRRRAPRAMAPMRRPQAVLLDRDGTLVVDVPYNGDPAAVQPMPGAAEALARLRAAGIDTAVVSNQSGIGRGLLSGDGVAAVNRRVEELLGPLGPWLVCPHAPDDGCDCRKPAPGLVLRAAELLGADPSRCALIGDVGADVEAAHAAGARPILVPTAVTRAAEIEAAPEVAPDLAAAVDLLLGRAAA
jgi:histidinol-phosphate phosphatase family protein